MGPRLTGSENLTKANHWAEDKFKAYGCERVHSEPWTMGRGWTRGRAEARITAPAVHPMAVASYGWVRGTNGPARGPVVFLNASKPADLEPYKGKLKGAIVMLYSPRALVEPRNFALTPYGDSVDPMNQPNPPLSFRFFGPVYRFLTEQGAAALLMSSDKTHGLLNTFGLGWLATPGPDISKATGETWDVAPTPAVYLSWEDYNLIWRLLQRGAVELELNVENTYTEKPIEVLNTVAEIGGAEKPDEIVMLGAHIDCGIGGRGRRMTAPVWWRCWRRRAHSSGPE